MHRLFEFTQARQHDAGVQVGDRVGRLKADGFIILLLGSREVALGGQLICEDEPLSQIAADLSRHYTIPVQVSGGAAGRRFSGVLELGDEANVVRRLADYLSLSARRTDGAFILS